MIWQHDVHAFTGAHAHCLGVEFFHLPMGRHTGWQLPLAEHELECRAAGFEFGLALHPHGVGVEAFDAPNEGVVANVLAGCRVLRVVRQIHQRRETGVGAGLVGGPERVDHHAPIRMVKRHPTGGIYPTKSNNDGQSAQPAPPTQRVGIVGSDPGQCQALAKYLQVPAGAINRA